MAGHSRHPASLGVDDESPAIGPQPARPPGRPSTGAEIRRLVIAMATNNPTWGYQRITAELGGLGHQIGASTVWRILNQHGIDPAPHRSEVTWSQFLHSQAAVACDFWNQRQLQRLVTEGKSSPSGHDNEWRCQGR